MGGFRGRGNRPYEHTARLRREAEYVRLWRGVIESITYGEWRPGDWTSGRERISCQQAPAMGCRRRNTATKEPMRRNGHVWIPLHPSQNRGLFFSSVESHRRNHMSMAVSDFIFNACSFLSVFASLFLSHCARSAAVSGGGEVTAMIFFFF